MAFPLFLAFFVLLSPLLLVPSDSEQEPKQIHITCPKSFDCQNLGPLYFPLNNSTQNSQCGLCTVTCNEQNPRIQLGDEGPLRYEYEVRNIISQADDGSRVQIQIHDPLLQDHLGQRKCGALGPNMRFPNSSTRFRNSSTISFKTLNDEITLFKCKKSSFDFEGFHKYTNCPVPFDLYYYEENRKDQLQPSAPAGLNCSEILLSMKPPDLILVPSDLFVLVSADFTVELHVSEQCLECHRRGGQCQDYHQKFECTAKQGPNLGLILGTVIPCSLILMILSAICVFKHWNYVSSFFLSRNTSSSNPSPEVDLEWSSIFFGVPVFSYSELEDATNKFDPSKELGDGGFGTVYYGKLRDGREVAVKRLYEHNYKRVTQFMNEVDILTRLRHPNLVSLYGCTSRHSRELLLVYEYIPNGTVADHLFGDQDKYCSLPWSVRMDIATETASALAYLHASDIIHRDIKTNNVLLDSDFHVKVADFGLSRLFPTDVTHVSTAPQGTPGYVDPEYHQCYQLTDKSDVYSFGVVLIELVSSLPAVDVNRHRHEINLANLATNMIQNGAFNELIDASLGFQSDSEIERMTTSVAEVAFRCVQLEKEMRPTMEEVFMTLKEIQGYKDEQIGKGPPPPPDGDHVVLLKNTVPSSPVSVTNRWVSSSNSSVSGG